ncbi:zinc-ribbon domain-containing protein [Christensenella intestinihominis]|uniref:zinc-ribbon domain-containing protein n=1 Tax=Christensenella intestinihominis TaxID=1851429 RepID=UPI000834B974|nr:zinc-ribbon domain-containing protein [Christensenella intestinihominis]
MKYCNQCKKEVSDGAKYCIHCGADIVEQQEKSVKGKSTKQNLRKWICIALAVLLIFAGLVQATGGMDEVRIGGAGAYGGSSMATTVSGFTAVGSAAVSIFLVATPAGWITLGISGVAWIISLIADNYKYSNSALKDVIDAYDEQIDIMNEEYDKEKQNIEENKADQMSQDEFRSNSEAMSFLKESEEDLITKAQQKIVSERQEEYLKMLEESHNKAIEELTKAKISAWEQQKAALDTVA